MKSLKLLKCISYAEWKEKLESTNCIAVDSDSQHVFFATEQSLVGFSSERNEIVSEVPLEEFLKSNDVIIGMENLSDEMALCLALSSGDVLMYNIGQESLECVGSFSCGLLAMSWSPDREIVVLVTGEHQLILMNREFDPLIETDLHPDDFGEAKFVNVGWGKKETQFHGSEGKQAAKVKSEDVLAATASDDGKVRVSWRGDGQYFAVSCIHRSQGCRVIRTWSRDGIHHSTSERLNGLEHTLSWKPSGSLIASTQQLPQKHVVRLLERNGLAHGDFTISSGTVKELSWNADSTVLCVWLEDNGFSTIQLFSVNNYHWYLKQSVVQKDKVAGFLWDSEHACRMHVWLQDGRYLMYEWTWTTFSSHCPHELDLSTVAVIDGDEVLITPFKLAVVPPPMAGYKLKLPSNAQDISFSPLSNRLAIVTSNLEIVIHDILKLRDGSTNSINEENMYKISLPETITHCISISHLTLLSDATLLFVTQFADRTSAIYSIKIENTVEIEEIVRIEGGVLTVNASIDDIAVQLDDGKIFKFDPVNKGLYPWVDNCGKHVQFPQPCSHTEICSFNDDVVMLGLTQRYRFYVNSLEIAKNCTSFQVHQKFALLTTHAHTIRCVPRSIPVKQLITLADDKAHPYDESVRRVERGSKIVISGGNMVVLQMPRGNLEVIYPRALLLSAIRDHLTESRYDLAFKLMKKHRINMNLIHDHNPEKFLKEVDVFVEQIGDVDSLNIFLTELSEKDVTITMYDTAYKDRKSTVKAGKVDRICDRVREILLKTDQSKYFLAILTCFVKKTRADLESALYTIRELKDSKLCRISMDEAMKYLLYLVDVNQLFDIALGTYDFDLVLMVAEKSQKDPKEYLPLLNQLREMEDSYRKFSIDKMLKRYSSALKHIVECPDRFEECLELVVDFDLYTAGLELFQRSSDQYKRIAKAQAQFLEGKKLFEEAGLAYWKAEDWENAIHVFTRALCWREALCMAEKGNFEISQKLEIARDLSSKLKSIGRYPESAQILDQYLQDYEEAIITLIDGELWTDALYVIHRQNRTDFLETSLKPKLLETVEHHTDSLPELRRNFQTFYDRLCTVRKERLTQHIDLISETNYNDADADLYSDMSSASGDSVTSKRTQSSFFSTSSRTNRSRKKVERKKFSLKQGSPNEDVALVDALLKIINRVESQKIEIGSLLKILVLFDLVEEAMEIQEFLVDFLELIKKSIPEIWLEDEDGEEFGSDSTAQSLALAAQQRRQVFKEALNKEPTLRSPPVLKSSHEWKLRTLKR